MSEQTRVNGFAGKGDLVAYEDQKNPRREGVVVYVNDAPIFADQRFGHAEFTVEFEDGEKTTSDLRQHGWTFVLSPEERKADYEAARDAVETDRAYAAREEYLNVRAANRPF